MENSYGIGIANRYELFYVDEEAGATPNKTIKKAKQQKKSAASANVAANGASTIEKENKPANSNKALNAAPGKSQSQSQQSAPGKSVKSNANSQNVQQNVRNDRPPRDGKDGKHLERKSDVQNGENREQRHNRNNRKIRENQFNNSDGNAVSSNNNRSGGGKNFNNDRGPPSRRSYGKREFDRQSGSDKTGVKAVDKRDGAGAHNWGTHKQDIDDYNKGNADWDNDRDGLKSGKDEKANGDTKADEQGKETSNEQVQIIEEETKEITLDEWKAQRAERAKPQYNIRKAGEGEDTSQWKKMIALESRKKKSDESEEEYEYDPSMYPQRVGRQKFLDIDIHFNDGPRGNVNRRRGRQRGQRTWNGSNIDGQESNNSGNANINNTTNNANSNNNFNSNNNRRRNQSYRNRQERGRYDERRQNAPKVDDEHDFPSLG